jgi:centrosomal protein CEP104
MIVFDRVTPAEVARSVDRLLPELLSKSGDPTPRIHHMAVHTILSMADCREVRLTKQFLFFVW